MQGSTVDNHSIFVVTKKEMKENITITAKGNQRERTFTLRCYNNGKMYAKYRTTPMTQEEFDSEGMNTQNDWKQFLTTDEYYKVK
jgi:hypothetical protein